MFCVTTHMNDSIHIEIQMVKLGKKSGIGNDLIDLGVSLTDPSIELWKSTAKLGLDTKQQSTVINGGHQCASFATKRRPLQRTLGTPMVEN
jgi:hypothetical protein